MAVLPGARLRRDGAVSRRRPAKAEEESIAELLATTQCWLYLGPVVVWAPIRAAEDLRDTP
jgi:hypothetical protein